MKVGDYVRTEKGEIGKITYISEYNTAITTDYSTNPNIAKCVGIKSIIKSSPNIIDLIEVGDYINGWPVLHKENNELVCGLLLRYKEEDIQNVVTKEQFKDRMYKVGG